jgi:hypothetical protein
MRDRFRWCANPSIKLTTKTQNGKRGTEWDLKLSGPVA